MLLQFGYRIHIRVRVWGCGSGYFLDFRRMHLDDIVVVVMPLFNGAGPLDPCVFGKGFRIRKLLKNTVRRRIGTAVGDGEPSDYELIRLQIVLAVYEAAKFDFLATELLFKNIDRGEVSMKMSASRRGCFFCICQNKYRGYTCICKPRRFLFHSSGSS
ncbi:hypothetical protein SD70_12660 [Gordoniibacillus kamchatkensis]|uniref:Uncharacterized protein n=1 Tax=Gordoniibacillus kamchatkensis TaxID=1590651 RepID=A0ABR5AHU1_9BACL|nr:hypothetical protein SD70_12660 [Paenibacillus sp. VKM B-2647]